MLSVFFFVTIFITSKIAVASAVYMEHMFGSFFFSDFIIICNILYADIRYNILI